MNRKFLEALGLDKEAIDKIMAENGNDIELQKKEVQKIETERDSLKETLENTQKELKEFEKLDVEGQKAKIAELEKKYTDDTTALTEKLQNQTLEHVSNKFIEGYKFSSNSAKKAALNELKSQGFKLDGETLLGAKDFMEKMKESDPQAFVIEDDNTPPPNTNPPPTWGKGGNNGNPPPTESFDLGSALRGK